MKTHRAHSTWVAAAFAPVGLIFFFPFSRRFAYNPRIHGRSQANTEVTMSNRTRLSRDQKRRKKLAKRQGAHSDRPTPYQGREFEGSNYAHALFLAERAILEVDIMTGGRMTDQDVERSLEYLVLDLRGQRPSGLPTQFQSMHDDGRREDLIAEMIKDAWHSGDVRHALQELTGILRKIWHSVRTRHDIHGGPRGYLKFLEGLMAEGGVAYRRMPGTNISLEEWAHSAPTACAASE